jgi:nucleotidyltransferase-like protein
VDTEELIARWVGRLRVEVPDAVAILVGGSVLRGDAGPHSDLDFAVIVAAGPRDEWPAWFDDEGGRLVRVSVWIRDVDAWFASAEEPQEWAFGLASTDPARLCWAADDAWGTRFADGTLSFPAAPPELDHFEGESGKVANAWLAGDELALRLAAQDLARSVVSLLVPLNPGPPVRSRVEALRRLLDFPVAPPGYRADMVTCLGLTGNSTVAEVHAAAGRLVLGTVELLPEHDADLRRYLEQAWV